MAVTASATPSLNITYTLSQVGPKLSVNEMASIGYYGDRLTFGNGTGIGSINFGVRETGYLVSGETLYFDLTSMYKTIFNTSLNINFSDVKGAIVTNTYNPTGIELASDMPYFNIRATGLEGLSGLFNGGSGNIKLRPQSTWTLTDYVGVSTNTVNKKISLIDSGSGVPYELIVIGVTG